MDNLTFIDGLKVMFKDTWRKAEAAERSAIAWERDAALYVGRRKEWRLEKAMMMRGISIKFMELSTGEWMNP